MIKKFKGIVLVSFILNILLMPVVSIYAVTNDTQISESVVEENQGELLEENQIVEEDLSTVLEQETDTIETITPTPVSDVKKLDEIAIEEEINRNYKIIKPTFRIYSKPFGTEGAEVISTLSDYVEKNGSNALITTRVVTTNNIEVYHIANIGWVDHRAFSEYLTYQMTETNQMMKIVNQKFYIYNEPYGSYGSQRGLQVKEKFKESSLDVQVTNIGISNTGIEVYQVANVGWVDKRAFQPYATLSEEEIENRYMKITNSNFFLYNQPFGTYGSKRIRKLNKQVEQTGEEVFVLRKALTTEGVTVYELKDLGWVDYRSLSEYHTIVGEPEKIERNLKVVRDTFYIYTEAFGTRNSKRKMRLSEYVAKHGTNVYVEEKAKTTQNVTVYKLKGLGWVDQNALKDYETVENREDINKDMKIVKDTFYIYSEPFGTFGSVRKKRLSQQVKEKGVNVYVEEKAKTTQNVTVYKLKGLGWVDYRALGDYDTLVGGEKKTNLYLRIVKDSFYIYKEPFGTKGSVKVQRLRNYVPKKGHNVRITKEATTSAKIKTYYIEGVGWVDHRAVGKYATIKSTKTLNRPMAVAKQGYYIYSEPFGTKNFARKQQLATYVSKNGKNVYATKEVTTTDGLKLTHLRNLGWVDSRALIDSQQAKLDKVQALLNRKYSSSAYGIQVTSLSDGSSAGVNANTRFTAASTGKLPAIYYTQKKISTGQISPKKQFLYDDRINQMPNSYMRGGAGVLQGQPYGRYFALETILNWTIKYSDNQGTNFIAYHAADRYDNKMKNEISSIIGRRWDSPFSISAKENALLMAAIYRQGGQSIGYLQNTVYDNQRIPKYLPVKVAHKIGDVYDYRHDVAIVYAKEPYVLSVMTKGRSYENISILSKEIYDIMK